MASPAYAQFNCYEVLQVAVNASPPDIKTAFREACRRHHPDLGGSHDAMLKVNAAYEVLSDPVSRIAHDQYWSVRVAPRAKRESSAHPTGGSEWPASATGRQRPTADDRIATEPLSTLRARVRQRIEEEAEKIQATFQSRLERLAVGYQKRVSESRRALGYSLVVGIVSGVIGIRAKLALLVTLLSVLTFGLSLFGPTIGGRHRSPLSPLTRWRRVEAEKEARVECDGAINGLEKYNADLAEIVDLVLRTSSFDDSESQVARRISTAFFVMGYRPVRYDAGDRILSFTDGSEQIIVRFRHRSGQPVNVAYVQKLVDSVRGRSSAQGYLFCSPGLSGNAAALARAHGVHCYTIETMTQWIDSALAGDYGGPDGDILANLDELKKFLSALSNRLPGQSSNSRYSGRRRGRRRRLW